MMNRLEKLNMQKKYSVREENRRKFSFIFIFIMTFAIFFCGESPVHCQGWPDIKIRLLPDDSFAVVERDVGTKVRHLPHHDINGKLDEEQMIFCLGSLTKETWLESENEAIARGHLEKHYGKFIKKLRKKEIDDPININEASLKELVALPQIGPVIAVKIVKYRDGHNMYFTIEDIKKVEGIGRGTFAAIRHYICVE